MATTFAATATYLSGWLRPGDSDVYSGTLSAGSWEARAEAWGSGSDLDIYVYDANGRLIGEDELTDNVPMADFYLPYRQYVRIVVENNGSGSCNYEGVVR